MSRASRGGLTLKSGKIGRVNCLRQQMLMPGEKVDINLDGQVRLETLRERDVMRINAHLGIFMTPLRWLWPEFTDYLREGPNTSIQFPTFYDPDWSNYGIGCYGGPVQNSMMGSFWKDHLLSIHKHWYRWPEDPEITAWPADGAKAVPLSKAWSRCRYTATPGDSQDYMQGSSGGFDVRDLAETQAKFRSAMKRDVLSYNRWMEFVRETWKGDGSREVDKVPIMIDQVEVGVNPREMPATDGPSFGQWQSMYDFKVSHGVKSVIAPEHCLISYMLTLRFGSIIEGRHPLGATYQWQDLAADPEWHAAAQPQPVILSEVAATDANTTIGYLPEGWKWRCDHDIIGSRIDEMDSFPYMDQPTTQEECKDATRVKNAFRSNRLGDYVADIFISEESRQPIGNAMDSYFSGMVDCGVGIRSSNDEFPKGGKML